MDRQKAREQGIRYRSRINRTSDGSGSNERSDGYQGAIK
jgi:hypothetical protein